MIKGILFDKDGTLIEFESMWHQVMTYIFKELEEELGVTKQSIIDLKNISGYTYDRFSQESLIQYSATSEIIEIWYNILQNNHEKMDSLSKGRLFELFEENAIREEIHIEIMENIVDMLDYLNKKGYILGIATSDNRISTYNSLKKVGIYHYFSYIGSDDGDTTIKPSPQIANRFCERYKIPPNEVLIVGDSVSDMEFAINANAQFVGIRSSYNDSAQFHEKNVPVVDKTHEIIQMCGL